MSRPAPNLRLVASTEMREHELRVGDIVRTGDNLYPRYEVVAISGERAWVRDGQYGSDHVIPIGALRRISL